MTTIFADSNRAQIRYIQSQNGWGTIPTSGSTRELRFTGSTVTTQKDTQVTDEIRTDRMVADVIEVGVKSSGEFNVEFSAGSHDDFMAGFAFGAWTRPMTFDLVRGNVLQWMGSTSFYINGFDYSSYFFVGRRIRTAGFVNPSNNGYFQISAIAYNSGANATEITFSAGAGVAETGTAVSVFYDANDVIVMNNTTIRAGTGGASTFDSNGTNAFASAIAAGQLNVGQKIYVESPLGFGAGSVTFASLPTAGNQIVVSDGNNAITFQFGGTIGNNVTPIAIAVSVTAQATALALAINTAQANGQLQVTATSSAGAVNLRSLNGAGGSITQPTGSATVVNFTGGDDTQNGVFQITGLTSDVLTVTPTPNTNANGSNKAISIKGSMLRNPSAVNAIIPPDFVYEVGFTDVNQYFLVDGLKVSSMKYDITSGQILKGSFGLSGSATTIQSSTVLGNAATYTPLNTTATDVMNATVNVGTIKINGTPLTTAIQSISFEGENNLRDQTAVSSKFPVGIGAGRMDIKGSAKCYFANGNLWSLFINHTFVSLTYSQTDGDNNHYEWTLPSVVFSTDSVNPSAGNQDVMEDIEFMARRDPTTNCQFQIDRFSNILPVTQN